MDSPPPPIPPDLERVRAELAALEAYQAELLGLNQRSAALSSSSWSPHAPTERQAAFLALDCREALFGGAAGGGKTDALLMAALQYVDVPGYAALIFRRTYQDLALPNAIMDRMGAWLRPTSARWHGVDHTWEFPSGARITFGYLQTENDKYRYQGAEATAIFFDELTQFTESQYLYLFSRLRRLEGVEIPLRMRAASNPGGVGHEWVRQRFVAPHDEADRVFVPSKLADNPHLDREEYVQSLDQLDAVTRAQLLEGDWDVLPQGDRFKREWFGDPLRERPAMAHQWVRYWDKAGTEDAGDWTAGVLMARLGATYIVADVVRGQWSPKARNAIIRQTTAADAAVCRPYAVWVEQEPGSGGKESALTTIAELAGYDVHAEPVTGSKVVRANPYAAQAEARNVRLVSGDWNSAYLSELCAFPNGPHDDQVDASSGAFVKLALPEPRLVRVVVEDTRGISPV